MAHRDPKPLIARDDIDRRVTELAKRIDRDYRQHGELVMVGVLKGAFIFLSDLARRLTIPRRIEFMAVSSYDRGDVASGAVRLVMDLRESVEDRHVLIVEDIVDTGRTLQYLTRLLAARGPASTRTCALVRKQARHEVDVRIDYLGFDIDDVWVVGYGLDISEKYRALPYIGVVDPARVDP